MSINKILVAVDLIDSTEAILSKARELAGLYNAEIKLVHIPNPDISSEDFDLRVAEETETLKILVENLNNRGVKSEGVVLDGKVSKAILKYSKRHKSDMIIIGKHHHSKIFKLIFGETSNDIIESCDIPVLVIPLK